MKKSNDRLEEYVDGLLSAEECREVETALARDPELREELHRVRRFLEVLEGLSPAESDEAAVRRVIGEVRARQRRRGWILRLAVASAAAAAAWLLVTVLTPPEGHRQHVQAQIEAQWLAFGRRLGAIAAERREGRVPRTGVGDLEVPPAVASGIVFEGALEELSITLAPEAAEEVKDAVADHFVRMRGTGTDLASEYRRSRASLALFRRLRDLAGEPVADAYYDIFRPALADLETARRVRAGTLRFVVAAQLDPELSRRYLDAYVEAVARLRQRYGEPQVVQVLSRLAPGDRRTYWLDAAQDGVSRDAVLAIRAQIYRAAFEAGAEKLYVEVGS
ncbi:MAG: anti-sigma factor family protein [Planctomycetota bacterium]